MTVNELIVKLESLSNKDEHIFIRTKIETESRAGVSNIVTELCVEHYSVIEDLEYLTILSEVY